MKNMYKNTGVENLEIKLQNARIENFEKFEKIEKSYNKNYKKFINNFFKTNLLWTKKTIWAIFQLEKFNWKSSIESLNIALEKWFKILPIWLDKKEILKNKIISLEKNKLNFWEIFREKTDFWKDKNYPILESLFEWKVLNNSEMILVFSNYEKEWDIRLSLNWLKKEKKDIIKKYFYELNSTKKESRIENFSEEYSSEIRLLENKYSSNIVNWVVKFVWRNFFKMKPYKKNIESNKLRLRRTFKIALLKLLRIKYSWFNIDELIKKIDSMQDFESMFKLIIKLIDIIPENNELLEKFSLKEEVDNIDEVITEAESNKEKILFLEESTIKICEIIDKGDKKLEKKILEKILDEDTNIIWEDMIFREEKGQNIMDLFHTKGRKKSDDEEEDLEEVYKKLKIQFNLLEKKKQKLFASWDFDSLDSINDEILKIMIKLEKIEMIIV